MNFQNSITSVSELKTRQVQAVTHIKIAEGLTEIPQEIFQYSESLEILDLSNNQISDLPDNFSELKQLKTLFLSNNCFTEFPPQLFFCPALDMLGFKANQIQKVTEGVLPKNTRWLILTDNNISELPNDIGNLTQLKKCMLAGNVLQTLPDSLKHCESLQLLRISANQLTELPTCLPEITSLTWLALAGNPFCSVSAPAHTLPVVAKGDLTFGELLGQGASGLIYKATLAGEDCAVKLFKGEVTSDGYPQDELTAYLEIPQHPNLIKVKACLNEESAQGVIMDLIPKDYRNLGFPPSLASCTRDVFDTSHQFDEAQIYLIIQQMADVLGHIHRHQFIHGDVYAHNVLIDSEARLLFSDFGAACNIASFSKSQQKMLFAAEYRAFSYFVDDIVNSCASFNVSHLAENNTLVKIYNFCQKIIQQPEFDADFLKKISKIL